MRAAVISWAMVRTSFSEMMRAASTARACRARMAVGDVEAAYRKQLALGDHQAFPCPNGRWDGERFAILDGRHAFISALMLGMTHLLVAWTEGPSDAPQVGR